MKLMYKIIIDREIDEIVIIILPPNKSNQRPALVKKRDEPKVPKKYAKESWVRERPKASMKESVKTANPIVWPGILNKIPSVLNSHIIHP